VSGEQSVAELCRRGGIAANLNHRSSKDFLEFRIAKWGGFYPDFADTSEKAGNGR